MDAVPCILASSVQATNRYKSIPTSFSIHSTLSYLSKAMPSNSVNLDSGLNHLGCVIVNRNFTSLTQCPFKLFVPPHEPCDIIFFLLRVISPSLRSKCTLGFRLHKPTGATRIGMTTQLGKLAEKQLDVRLALNATIEDTFPFTGKLSSKNKSKSGNLYINVIIVLESTG